MVRLTVTERSWVWTPSLETIFIHHSKHGSKNLISWHICMCCNPKMGWGDGLWGWFICTKAINALWMDKLISQTKSNGIRKPCNFLAKVDGVWWCMSLQKYFTGQSRYHVYRPLFTVGLVGYNRKHWGWYNTYLQIPGVRMLSISPLINH